MNFFRSRFMLWLLFGIGTYLAVKGALNLSYFTLIVGVFDVWVASKMLERSYMRQHQDL